MREVRADIAIVGAGGAGVCAAVAASENGASVVLIEKAPVFGACATAFAGCVFGVGSKIQKERGINFTKQQAFDMFMEYSHWQADSRIVRQFVDRSAETLDWLMERGIEFPHLITKTGRADEIATAHVSKEPNNAGHGGVTIVQQFAKRAEKLGAVHMLGYTATGLIKQDDAITGVYAESKDEKVKINAKAVIISTGGYGCNADMIREHDGYELGEDLILLHEFKQLQGDGLRLAWEAGAAKTGMGPQFAGYVIKNPGIAAAAPWIVLNQLKVCIEQPFLWVDKNGRRFMNESMAMAAPLVANAIGQLREKCAYVIFDSMSRDFLAENGPINNMDIWGETRITNLDAQIEKCIAAGNKDVFTADCIGDLCAKSGVSHDGLKQTLLFYNGYAKSGLDEEFGKPAEYIHPVRTPRFYAFRIVSNFYGTIGGIKTDDKMRVLNGKGDVIKGLYAAGADACNHYGIRPTYNIMLAGGTLGWALNSGKFAGENAADMALGK